MDDVPAAVNTYIIPYMSLISNMNAITNFFIYTMRHKDIRKGIECLFTCKKLTKAMIAWNDFNYSENLLDVRDRRILSYKRAIIQSTTVVPLFTVSIYFGSKNCCDNKHYMTISIEFSLFQNVDHAASFNFRFFEWSKSFYRHF